MKFIKKPGWIFDGYFTRILKIIPYVTVGNLQYVIQFNFIEFVPLCYGTFSSKYLNISSDTTILIQKVGTSFSHEWPSLGFVILLSGILHVHSYYNYIIVKCFGLSSAKWGKGVSFPNVSQMEVFTLKYFQST